MPKQLITPDRRRKAVIFDVDGVLADASKALMDMPAADWEWFHLQCESMPLCKNGVPQLARLLHQAGLVVVEVSCRPEIHTEVTLQWLERQCIPFDEVLLRPRGVRHEDWKRMALLQLGKTYSIVLALDDDPNTIAMYEELGVPAIWVNSGHWDEDKPWINWEHK